MGPTVVAARMTVAGVALSFGMWTIADENSFADARVGEIVPLNDSDLREITGQVLERNPLLSSSPGIKFASAQRSVRSTDLADVIYYPHAENSGIRQAFQVQCWRQAPDPLWKCKDAEIRRYLQLDSQDFEVRGKGDISFDEALALISATRTAVHTDQGSSTDAPQTVVMILPGSDGYLVSWGSPEGYQEVRVKAHLSDGGESINPEDWHVRIENSTAE